MRSRVGLVVVLAVFGVFLGLGTVRADGEEHHEGSAEPEHHEGSAEPEHHEGSAEHHEAEPEHHEAEPEHHEAEPEHHEAEPEAAVGSIDEDGDVVTDPFDEDGDGKVTDEEIADRKEWGTDLAGFPTEPDEKSLESRPADSDLKPSMTAEAFQKIVRLVKRVVLKKMKTKIAEKTAKRMSTFTMLVSAFSLLGLLLLFMPLALAKKYPGQGKVLFKYSALAAFTFFLTVNLFGGVLIVLRTAQGALSDYTNPSIAIASGTFDTLDDNAEDYITMGRELFVPTLEQMKAHPDEQPAVLLLENGQQIVKDAKVFLSIGKMFKKVDFIFSMLPIILMFVTMVLFVLAIKPTLIEIVKLPMLAASGQSAGLGREVVKRSLRRVGGEFLATLSTIGVLALLTVISAFVLGKIVQPALVALLDYFSLAVSYLQFVPGASSGLVFVTLFGTILFLVLNLAALILSMSFFLGKSQKIFQQRFNDGTPISTHKRFFVWGIPSVLLVQVFPWLYVLIAEKLLMKINASITSGVTNAEQVSWGKLMLAGPIFLVVGFAILFWAARGAKAIRFLQAYKVKPPVRSAR